MNYFFKFFLFSTIFFILISCRTANSVVKDVPLFEILTQEEYGGASFKFFEILSEPKEIQMLINDEKLKKKISLDDTKNSNFIILNIGEKPTSGYSIDIEEVVETEKNILITVNEIDPKSNIDLKRAKTYPFLVLKINSKKEIIFK